MAERPGIDFEQKVEMPANPFEAARLYLAVLAYPERGAGQPGGLGVPFAQALWQYVVWNRRRAKGLRDVRRLFGDPTFMPPRRRDFEGALNRGRNRVQRRAAAFDIVGNRMINGFLNAGLEAGRLAAAGRAGEAFERASGSTYAPIKQDVWDRNTPTARRIVHRDLDRWSERFGLNDTGRPADAAQKGKDLIRRGYLQSRPVLHMAHGLNQILADRSSSLLGLEQADWLLVLLWNAEAWVWQAIEHAMTWRLGVPFDRVTDLSPADMIEIIPPKERGIMPPAWLAQFDPKLAAKGAGSR